MVTVVNVKLWTFKILILHLKFWVFQWSPPLFTSLQMFQACILFPYKQMNIPCAKKYVLNLKRQNCSFYPEMIYFPFHQLICLKILKEVIPCVYFLCLPNQVGFPVKADDFQSAWNTRRVPARHKPDRSCHK